jgi:nitrite reductase/ring-hydroxylating ferredoxin subunit
MAGPPRSASPPGDRDEAANASLIGVCQPSRAVGGSNTGTAYDQPVTTESELRIAPIPPGLTAIGARTADFMQALRADELPPGEMRRVTFGDLDVLVAWTADGIVAIDDRCPHMSAPLSLGKLEGCLLECPLHSGQFDLSTGEATRMPTTGGLDPDGNYHPVWAPPDREPKPDPPGVKAEARRFTRVRRIRYYPMRVRDGMLEIAVPRG